MCVDICDVIYNVYNLDLLRIICAFNTRSSTCFEMYIYLRTSLCQAQFSNRCIWRCAAVLFCARTLHTLDPLRRVVGCGCVFVVLKRTTYEPASLQALLRELVTKLKP